MHRFAIAVCMVALVASCHTLDDGADCILTRTEIDVTDSDALGFSATSARDAVGPPLVAQEEYAFDADTWTTGQWQFDFTNNVANHVHMVTTPEFEDICATEDYLLVEATLTVTSESGFQAEGIAHISTESGESEDTVIEAISVEVLAVPDAIEEVARQQVQGDPKYRLTSTSDAGWLCLELSAVPQGDGKAVPLRMSCWSFGGIPEYGVVFATPEV
jgi:hypothetical protein